MALSAHHRLYCTFKMYFAAQKIEVNEKLENATCSLLYFDHETKKKIKIINNKQTDKIQNSLNA